MVAPVLSSLLGRSRDPPDTQESRGRSGYAHRGCSSGHGLEALENLRLGIEKPPAEMNGRGFGKYELTHRKRLASA